MVSSVGAGFVVGDVVADGWWKADAAAQAHASLLPPSVPSPRYLLHTQTRISTYYWSRDQSTPCKVRSINLMHEQAMIPNS